MDQVTLFFGYDAENSGFIKGEHMSGFSNVSALWSRNYQHAVGICYDKTRFKNEKIFLSYY